MGEKTIKQPPRALRATLERKQKELNLILEIDHVRDTLPEPSTMLAAIANVLLDQFQAELCLLCLLDRETGELELKTIVDRGEKLGQFEPIITRELTRRVVEAEGATIWTGRQVLSESVLAQLSDSLQLIATPIILGTDRRLGALLLARCDVPFDQDDVELLKIAESQIDSAVVQGYAYYDLLQRNKELETIYKIDHIRDQHLPFDEMLNRVLEELLAVIQAEMGFIMLYNHAQQQLELRATTHTDLFQVPLHYETINQIASQALQQEKMIYDNDLEGVLHSVLCIPLIPVSYTHLTLPTN